MKRIVRLVADWMSLKPNLRIALSQILVDRAVEGLMEDAGISTVPSGSASDDGTQSRNAFGEAA